MKLCIFKQLFFDFPTNVNKHCYTDQINEEMRALVKQLYKQELVMSITSVTAFSRVIGHHMDFENEGKNRAMKFEGVCSSVSSFVHVYARCYLLGCETA